jgi:hypothetical protein
MKCQKCGADLGGLDRKVASICLRVRGDEETRTYFLCTSCGVYSIWVHIEDFFTDNETRFSAGPVLREEGDKAVEMIRTCPNPDAVSCKCAAHREMEGWHV